MDNIFVIDAVNILFRSYYAIGGMASPKGEPTGALYGFIRSIYKLIKDYSPNYLVAVFDGPENKKSRTSIYQDYKSHRKGMPEDLVPQLEKALEFCKLAGIPYLSISGVEADDTMGSIAKWAEKKGSKTFLCSSDKDLCQLVSDRTFVIHLHKDNLLVDREKVKELFGVMPEQMVDLLAIMGDASDQIPGLEGFGLKTASSLLREFGSLDELLEHPEKVSGQKKQETLIQGKEIALMSRALAQIQTDVDFPKEEAFFHLKEPQLDALKAFYAKMHFMSLLREIDTSRSDTPQDTAYLLIDEEKALIDLIDLLMQQGEICIDTKASDARPMCARLVGIGFCLEPKKAWYIPLNGKLGKAKVLSLLHPLFQNPRIRFCAHHIKYHMHVLLNEGLELKQIAFDTILASYLLNPHTQRHQLDTLALEYFGKVRPPIEDLIGKGSKQIGMDQVEIEKISAYCCEEVDFTCRLTKLFQKELEKRELLSIFKEIELPLVPILLKMERNGIHLDVRKMQKMSETLADQIKTIEHGIYQIAGETFNLNSPKQLSAILFDKMGIKPPKKTATGYSTSADVLESLQNSSPIVKKILDYRTIEKLRSTYVDSLPNQVLPETGRIHCTFNQSVAATGRLSCQDPNLQNIPIRSPEGRKIREAFKPSQAGWSFVSGDYAQVELRILAHLSEDPSLIKAFQEGEDVHAYTASLVFNVPLQEVTPEMRHQAKAVNFGIVYGQQAFGLSQGLGIDYNEAAAFIETYFQRYHKVKEFLEFCKENARKTGRAFTLTGRQRPIPDMDSKNPMVRAAAERLAINTPLQGTAADLIKIAMIRVDAWLQEDNSLGMMILQIHDELLFEVPDPQIPQLSKSVQRIMEGIFALKVPLSVHISIGKNWGEC